MRDRSNSAPPVLAASSPQEQREQTLALQSSPSPRQSAINGGDATVVRGDRSSGATRGTTSFPDFSAFSPKPDALARAISGKADSKLSAMISSKLQAHQEMHADLFKQHAGAFDAIAALHGSARHDAFATHANGATGQAHSALSALTHTAKAMHETALNKIDRQLSELKPVSKWKKT